MDLVSHWTWSQPGPRLGLHVTLKHLLKHQLLLHPLDGLMLNVVNTNVNIWTNTDLHLLVLKLILSTPSLD